MTDDDPLTERDGADDATGVRRADGETDAVSDGNREADADPDGNDQPNAVPDGNDETGDVPDGNDETSDVPEWDDEYLDRVSGRLLYNYDLAKDREVAGHRFDLYGRMAVHSQKHFLHPSLSYAEHDATEHLFAKRVDGVGVADLERYVEFCHDLAEEWIDADEEHYGTDFSVALVAPRLRDDVRSFVSGFKDRTLLKYGYHGHYEVNLVVVAPDDEDVVASKSTGLDRAFALWESPEEESSGLLGRLF